MQPQNWPCIPVSGMSVKMWKSKWLSHATYTSRMSPTSENRCWRSSSRCRTRLVSLRSWTRRRSTSSWAVDDDGDGNWQWRGDDVSPVPSDDSRSPDPGVSAAADGSTPLELAPAVGFQTESSLCRCPDSPSIASFCSTTAQTLLQYYTVVNPCVGVYGCAREKPVSLNVPGHGHWSRDQICKLTLH